MNFDDVVNKTYTWGKVEYQELSGSTLGVSSEKKVDDCDDGVEC